MTRLRRALLLAACTGVAGAGHAQTANPPTAPTGTPVIRPQPNIDPGIKVAPKREVHLPTPVIRPHPEQGNTLVVPK